METLCKQRFLSKVCSILLSAAIFGCAAALPTEVTKNRPSASGQAIDVNAIHFTDISTGEEVTLGLYMKDHNLKYMLLTFGSLSCTACMEKAAYVETNLVGNAQMLGPNSEIFEAKGINIDPLQLRGALLDKVKNDHLTHLAWADVAGKSAMMPYFQPAGMDLGVPLTVMIEDDKMLWRATFKDHLTSEDLIKKVAATLGQDVKVEKPQEKKPVPISAVGLLGDEKPNRLTALPMFACGDEAPTTADVVLKDSSLRFILSDRAACEAESLCGQNKKILENFIAGHADQAWKLAVLGQTAHPSGETAAGCNAAVNRGGKEIYDVFADHFNWTYGAVTDQTGKKTLPTVQGPLTLAFDQSGKLVFSHEGLLKSSDLANRWDLDQFKNRADGPAFPMQSANGLTKFSTWRHSSKWSVLIFWDTLCASCSEEITEWHKPDHLLSYCAARPDFCQVASLDKAIFWDNDPASIPDYIQGVLHGGPDFEGFDVKGWNIPLYVDPVPNVGAPANRRWFENWVAARLNDTNRSILYDREGKVRGSWEAAPGGHGALDMLKELAKEP